jgi:hypothetical protein
MSEGEDFNIFEDDDTDDSDIPYENFQPIGYSNSLNEQNIQRNNQ